MASQPPAQTSPKAGDVLAGRYALVRPLGEGAMGVVWEARQVTTEKPVALKILKAKDRADVVRFLREAKIAAGLTHRSIAQVFDYWEVEGGGPVFLVMELLAGESLTDLLARVGRLSTRETVGVALAVASALRAAHAAGVVHRDLKPDNVFLSRSSAADPHVDVKVLDFGIAKTLAPDALATVLTQTGSVMGTPFYMAPEQVYGEKDVDARADIWALGVVLYVCLTGERPFSGENFGQIFRSISEARPMPLRERNPNVPPVLESLVLRMLSHDREARPSLAEITPLLSGAGLEAAGVSSPPPRTERLAPQAALTPSSSGSGPQRTMVGASASVPPPPRQTHVVAVALAAVAAVAAVVGSFVVLSGGGRTSAKPSAIELPRPPLARGLPTPEGSAVIAPTAAAQPGGAATSVDASSAVSGTAAAPHLQPSTATTPATAATRQKPSRPGHDPLGAGRF